MSDEIAQEKNKIGWMGHLITVVAILAGFLGTTWQVNRQISANYTQLQIQIKSSDCNRAIETLLNNQADPNMKDWAKEVFLQSCPLSDALKESAETEIIELEIGGELQDTIIVNSGAIEERLNLREVYSDLAPVDTGGVGVGGG